MKDNSIINPYWTLENKIAAVKLFEDITDFTNADGSVDESSLPMLCSPCCPGWSDIDECCGALIDRKHCSYQADGINDASDEDCMKRAKDEIIEDLNKEYGLGNPFVTQPYIINS